MIVKYPIPWSWETKLRNYYDNHNFLQSYLCFRGEFDDYSYMNSKQEDFLKALEDSLDMTTKKGHFTFLCYLFTMCNDTFHMHYTYNDDVKDPSSFHRHTVTEMAGRDEDFWFSHNFDSCRITE
ncbi:MAG: hypothetical protein EOP45_11355 [Sphingobacteriaceae bacterium]|nr:MAG: hypothetical protein EOP45_11355 [Sphingobacteriaceae bacterium]